jgi:hypothetical protein
VEHRSNRADLARNVVADLFQMLAAWHRGFERLLTRLVPNELLRFMKRWLLVGRVTARNLEHHAARLASRTPAASRTRQSVCPATIGARARNHHRHDSAPAGMPPYIVASPSAFR